ncbi:hypothetical protein JOB18_047571 [Solea senegalensis]|uniref:Uncharacterized protein n=1 Tax=Solea senegalensis TaxID=28829 RepID=A0AAV6QLH5_SOLSE|nr:hypothetical protein JOB18_047571 [Solea senegalensis]
MAERSSDSAEDPEHDNKVGGARRRFITSASPFSDDYRNLRAAIMMEQSVEREGEMWRFNTGQGQPYALSPRER